jgi:hypothetical protein
MTANIEGTPAKAGALAKVLKPATASRKANYSRDTIYCTSGMTTAALSTVARPPESVGVNNSRETGNMQQGKMPEMPETAFFTENSRKTRQKDKKFVKKRAKNFPFLAPSISPIAVALAEVQCR